MTETAQERADRLVREYVVAEQENQGTQFIRVQITSGNAEQLDVIVEKRRKVARAERRTVKLVA